MSNLNLKLYRALRTNIWSTSIFNSLNRDDISFIFVSKSLTFLQFDNFVWWKRETIFHLSIYLLNVYLVFKSFQFVVDDFVKSSVSRIVWSHMTTILKKTRSSFFSHFIIFFSFFLFFFSVAFELSMRIDLTRRLQTTLQSMIFLSVEIMFFSHRT